jgi:hypothetical protein
MSWIYLAEPASSGGPSTRPWLPTESRRGPSPTVKMNGALKGFFSAGKCEARSTLPLSARMSVRSRRQAFNERSALWASTPLSAASPARTSAWQALASAWKRGSAAAFSSKSCASLASLDRTSLLWRTFQLSLLGGGDEPLPSLPRSGMTAAGLLYRLNKSAPRTSATAGGSWPTPLKSDADKLSGPHYGKNDTLTSAARGWATPCSRDHHPPSEGHENQKSLLRDIRAWSTPSKGDGEGSRSVPAGTSPTGRKPNGSKAQMGLNVQAKSWATPKAQNACGPGFDDLQTQALGWGRPTPKARDYRGANTPEATERRKAEGHHQQLNDWAAYQSGHLSPATGKAGLRSWPLLLSYARRLRSLLGSRPPGQPGRLRSVRLNPLFEEWLLGSPIGMTEYEPAVTAWILSARKRPTPTCSVDEDEPA